MAREALVGEQIVTMALDCWLVPLSVGCAPAGAGAVHGGGRCAPAQCAPNWASSRPPFRTKCRPPSGARASRRGSVRGCSRAPRRRRRVLRVWRGCAGRHRPARGSVAGGLGIRRGVAVQVAHSLTSMTERAGRGRDELAGAASNCSTPRWKVSGAKRETVTETEARLPSRAAVPGRRCSPPWRSLAPAGDATAGILATVESNRRRRTRTRRRGLFGLRHGLPLRPGHLPPGCGAVRGGPGEFVPSTARPARSST